MGKKNKKQVIDYNDMFIDDVLAPKKHEKVKAGKVSDADDEKDTVTRAAQKATKQVKKEDGPAVQIQID